MLGGAGSPRHRPCEAHCVGLLKGMLLIERAGVKVLVQHVVQCTDHAVQGRRPSGRGAGGRVPGVATWAPLWPLLLQGPTTHVNSWGHSTLRHRSHACSAWVVCFRASQKTKTNICICICICIVLCIECSYIDVLSEIWCPYDGLFTKRNTTQMVHVCPFGGKSGRRIKNPKC